MWLTKNEKKVLKLLLANARLTDTEIAKELNIASQSVGRIRKVLEEDVIKGYTLKLDSKMLGLNLILIVRINCNNCHEKTIEEIEYEIKKLPDVGYFLKTLSGRGEHIIVAGFRNMEELEKFINEKKKIKGFNDYCNVEEIIVLPSMGILKHSNQELYNKLIDSCGTKNAEFEIE
jgi:Lrp/AsnC family transcriptional regulator, leucine-responsive regulatory protein